MTAEDEMKQALRDAALKEDEFWQRYGMPEGLKTMSFKAYQSFMDTEQKFLNNNAWIYQTPMARKMFMLGYLYAWCQYTQTHKTLSKEQK